MQVHITYAVDGVTVTGYFSRPQVFPTIAIDDSDAAVQAFLNPPIVKTVLPQDLFAQFTATDAATIRTAIGANSQYWLLWAAMQAQKDPMHVNNARFLAGWNALIQILGAPRMAAIATALGITVV